MPEFHKYCLGCSYILDGLPRDRCPECGRLFNPHDPQSYRSRPRSRLPRWAVALAGLVLVLLTVAIVVPALSSLSFRQRTIVEQLQSAVSVRGWTEDGILLSDGRQVQLPGFVALPVTSAALGEATQGGVEITDGRVYGLARVHHWCGNDPTQKHIARVDLADMLMFLGEGEVNTDTSVEPWPLVEDGGSFGQWGWEAGEFYSFCGWSDRFNDPKPRRPGRTQRP